MAEAVDAVERLVWVEAYARGGDAASVCARFGISRPTLRKWCARYKRDGVGGLERASSVPRRSPGRKLFAGEAGLVREWRSEGRSLTVIRAGLAARGVSVSVSTVRRALVETLRMPSPGRIERAGLFDTLLPDDALFRALADRITGGTLRPGDRLEEAALAREHRTGRRSVRVAMRSLAAVGLVSMAGGDVVVTAPTVQMVADAYAARRLVEIEIVRLVAARVNAAEIALLRQHVRRQADAERRGDKVSFVRLLTDFHLLLAALSGNAFLQSFVRDMAGITALGVLIYDQDGAPSCAVDEHRALIRSLERRDGAGAARQMRDHLGHNQARQAPNTTRLDG